MNSALNHRTQDDGQVWSRRWRTWLRTLGLAGGERSTSRVKRLEVLQGRITAQVQDRSGQLCDVEIRFTPWSDEEWQRVVDALSSQALFAAQLLAGDLPPELDRAVAAAGVQLLPARLAELEHDCSCHVDSNRKICEHVTTVYTALGELLPEDPWLLFRLRGRDQQGLLRSLRTQRSRTENQSTSLVHAQPESRRGESGFYRATAPAEEEIPSLSDQLDSFWGSGKAQQDFRPHIIPQTIELVLLRRLGPPPLGADAISTYDALTTLYRRISQSALDLAYAVDTSEHAENGESERS